MKDHDDVLLTPYDRSSQAIMRDTYESSAGDEAGVTRTAARHGSARRAVFTLRLSG
jgi:hypothetical protein